MVGRDETVEEEQFTVMMTTRGQNTTNMIQLTTINNHRHNTASQITRTRYANLLSADDCLPWFTHSLAEIL